MTAPIANDYPDWGRFQAQATKLYAQAVTPAMVANFTVDLGYVGDIPHLGVRVVNINGRYVMTINFYADQAKSINLGNHTVDMRDGDILSRTLPILGPFADVFFFAVATPINIVYAFYQATVPYSPLDTSSTANVLFSANPTLRPAGQSFLDCGRIWPGEATLFAALPPVASIVYVHSLDSAGVRTFLARVFGNGIDGNVRFFLPATHIQLEFFVGGGAAQNFIVALTAAVLGG